MSGYSGHVEFDFSIERFKNLKTGELIPANKVAESEEESMFEYQTINLEIQGRAYFSPGSTSGHPDDSYPEESDSEIIAAFDSSGKEWSNFLTKEETQYILDEMIEIISDKYYSGN